MRMLVNLVITVISNAVGLIVAAAVLDDMTLTASGFFIALAIFTLAMFVVRPMIQKAALKYANVLGGSSALIATLAALIITNLVSDSLSISGLGTWALATVIVWLMSIIGAVVIPWLLARRALAKARTNGAGPSRTPAR